VGSLAAKQSYITGEDKMFIVQTAGICCSSPAAMSKQTTSTCIKEHVSSQHIGTARRLGLRAGCLAQGRVEGIEPAAILCGLNMVQMNRAAVFRAHPHSLCYFSPHLLSVDYVLCILFTLLFITGFKAEDAWKTSISGPLMTSTRSTLICI